MMHRKILTVGLLIGLMLPLPTAAYVTPEEVLNDDDFSTRFVEPPPSRRDISKIKEEEARVIAERRAAELAAIQGNGLPAEEDDVAVPTDEDLHEAAPDNEEGGLGEILNAIDELKNKEVDAAELRDERMLQRIKLQQEQAKLRAQLPLEIQRLMNGESLHSGAPLSDTGPATVGAFLLLGAAITWTIRRVRRMERD